MAWAHRMDESPNPGENEEAEVRLGLFCRPDKKKGMSGSSPGSWLEML
jgi:hypothetical protein